MDKKKFSAEAEHQAEIEETAEIITTEDIVEQAVYVANAPDCSEEEHAENMLGMLGANIVDEEVYSDEEETQTLTMGGM